MTEERREELEQLLNDAKKSLVVRYGYGGPPIPVDVYRAYLQECWRYYGVDFLAYSFSTRFMCNIVDETKNSELLDFIKEELSQFVGENIIPVASYRIESYPADISRLLSIRYSRLSLRVFIERPLEITLVRGTKRAVSVFDRCSRPEGTHDFFQEVHLLEGVKLDTEVEVFDGVRLVPLPSSEISNEVVRYLPSFPWDAFIDQAADFFGKTLLVVDRPGLSIFHEPAPDPTFPQRHPINSLPFQVEVHDVKFPNTEEVSSFRNSFCHALSLVSGSPVYAANGSWFLTENESFNPHNGMRSMFTHSDVFTSSTKVGEADIEKAKCLYERLVDLGANDREKLRLPIDRWIRSKVDRDPVDKMIDLGIAFEALYVPDGGGDLTYKFSIRAARHLGKDKEHREDLLKQFKQIYDCRSDAVHGGELKQRPKFGEERITRSKFIERAQDLCRESIIKILEDGEIPAWDSLLLRGEGEQESICTLRS